jgi:hypothetical protein
MVPFASVLSVELEDNKLNFYFNDGTRLSIIPTEQDSEKTDRLELSEAGRLLGTYHAFDTGPRDPYRFIDSYKEHWSSDRKPFVPNAASCTPEFFAEHWSTASCYCHMYPSTFRLENRDLASKALSILGETSYQLQYLAHYIQTMNASSG